MKKILPISFTLIMILSSFVYAENKPLGKYSVNSGSLDSLINIFEKMAEDSNPSGDARVAAFKKQYIDSLKDITSKTTYTFTKDNICNQTDDDGKIIKRKYTITPNGKITLLPAGEIKTTDVFYYIADKNILISFQEISKESIIALVYEKKW